MKLYSYSRNGEITTEEKIRILSGQRDYHDKKVIFALNVDNQTAPFACGRLKVSRGKRFLIFSDNTAVVKISDLEAISPAFTDYYNNHISIFFNRMVFIRDLITYSQDSPDEIISRQKLSATVFAGGKITFIMGPILMSIGGR